MIVLADEDQRQAKYDTFIGSPTLRLPERLVVGRPESPLPDYETSQARHTTTILAKPHFYRRADSRFWRATFYALAIYLALSVVIGAPLIVIRITNNSKRYQFSPMPWTDGKSSSSYPGGDADSICNHWESTNDLITEGVFLANTQYSFNTSGSIAINSNISHMGDKIQRVLGNFTIDINSDPKAHEVHLSLGLRASTLELRKQIEVCFAGSSDDKILNIYGPSNLMGSDSLIFDIHLLYPQSSSPIYVKRLMTYLPAFAQTFGHLNQYIKFGTVSVESVASDIIVGSMQAEEILIKNSLAGITGTFNASNSLTLDTIEGPIHANITLVHDPKSTHPTFLTLYTGNSGIEANITLSAPTRNTNLRKPSARFIANMKTFNGPLTASIVNSPSTPSVPFVLEVQNDLAPSNITLDDKFNGLFEIQTKLAPAIVHEGVATRDDPSGKSRVRTYVYDHQSYSRMSGWVGWGKQPAYWDPQTQGHVVIMTSLELASLQLGSPS